MSDKNQKLQEVFDGLCKFVVDTLADEKNAANAHKLPLIPSMVEKILELKPFIN
jgi:hypothetical protein